VPALAQHERLAYPCSCHHTSTKYSCPLSSHLVPEVTSSTTVITPSTKHPLRLSEVACHPKRSSRLQSRRDALL
jgi:hypothetical protein